MNRKSGSRRNDPKDSAVEVMLTLLRAARAIEDRFDAALAKANLSGPKFGALTALAKAGEPLSLGDLAAKLTCVRSNITQLVDRLEADGLVRRVNDPLDRRGKRAAITALGTARRAAGARVIANLEKEMGTAMSALDHDALKRVLEAFK
jgi:DNA-binding MarR family transcriptional regulator